MVEAGQRLDVEQPWSCWWEEEAGDRGGQEFYDTQEEAIRAAHGHLSRGVKDCVVSQHGGPTLRGCDLADAIMEAVYST